jgi:hypothetical protein
MASIQPVSHGLVWVRSKSNPGLLTPPIVRKFVADTYATAIFTGSVVKLVNDGSVAICAASEAPGWVVAYVERYYGSDGLMRSGPYLPASTNYPGSASIDNPQCSVLGLIPCRDQVFEGNADTTGTSWATASAWIGELVDITTESGSTTTGRSTVDVDISSHGTGSGGQFMIEEIPQYGIGQSKMNDPSGTNWRVRVTVNPSELVDSNL